MKNPQLIYSILRNGKLFLFRSGTKQRCLPCHFPIEHSTDCPSQSDWQEKKIKGKPNLKASQVA